MTMTVPGGTHLHRFPSKYDRIVDGYVPQMIREHFGTWGIMGEELIFWGRGKHPRKHGRVT